MKRITGILALLLVIYTSNVFAHCEIPCGIYGDEMRFDMIREHITTVEKSMNQIKALSQENPVNYNQLVRWITNKEEHAVKIQDILWQYFLTQRVKPVEDKNSADYKKYQKQLELLHHMTVFSMKAKQTTDLTNIQKLRELTEAFYTAYFGEGHERHEH